MSLHRPADGSAPMDPSGRRAATHEERPRARSTKLAAGTLSCPSCDAPVGPPLRPLSPAEPLGCGFCSHEGAVRDFLTLGDPVRPTKVVVHVRQGAWVPARRSRLRALPG